MSANTAPIYPLTPVLDFGALTAANTNTNGTGTLLTSAAAGVAGSRFDKLRARALGTNVATVARVFVNNGSTNATATNNSLIGEIALPPTTASNAAEIGPDIEKIFDVSIPAGFKIMICLGTAVAAGWQFTIVRGDY